MANRKKVGRQNRRGRARMPRREADRSEQDLSVSQKIQSIPLAEMLDAIEEFKAIAHVDVKANGSSKPGGEERQKIFSVARTRPFSLKFDRPEKIVGCRARDGAFEYVVMFKCGPPLYAGFSVASHEELMHTAPWLLAEYIMERSLAAH